MTDVGFIFGLPAEKAVEFLRQKRLIAEKINEPALKDSALAKATRIANLSSLEMTKDIYQSLENARANGQSFGQWKAEMFEHFKKKGWIAGYEKGKGYLLADPKTGEFFGTPRRLETIYRTNMQAAYSAQRYQQLRDNAASRPYWQYLAVNDNRTRPAHSAMHGQVYRYDDPFWQVFYPPNGFNCRCTVTALNDRDIARRNLIVSSGEERLEDYERKISPTHTEKTKAMKTYDGSRILPDRGFGHNVGRSVYKPNLDLYPEKLAHQFAKREMNGAAFKIDYKQFENEFKQVKNQLKLGDKLNADDIIKVRNQLRKEYKFAAGVLSAETKALLGSDTATVWLSDDTLIKQFNSREGQAFGVDDYQYLPDVVNAPDKIIQDEQDLSHYRFFKQIGEMRLVAVLKVIGEKNEIFMQSFRFASEKQWRKAMK